MEKLALRLRIEYLFLVDGNIFHDVSILEFR